ncbi:MAG: hypothetical protein AAB296_10750, partial [Candidatus Desantisbacteria bacterium]
MKKLIVRCVMFSIMLILPLCLFADDNVEFEAVDDLTVSGTGGTKNDPDLEVKGASSFAKDVFIEAGALAGPYGGLGAYQNILTYSEAFNDTAWVKTNLNAITADTITAPYGTNLAEALTPLTAAATNIKQTSGTAAVASTPYTFSAWAKVPSATKSIVLTVGDGATNSTQTVTLTTSWQRVSVSYTASGTPSGNVFVQIGDATWTADTIHLWGAQLEQALTPGVYIRAATAAISAARGGSIVGNLHIIGEIYKNGSLFTGGSDWIKLVNDLYYNDGNVGIGTSAPSTKLEVNGAVTIAAVSGDSDFGSNVTLDSSKKLILDDNDNEDSYIIHDNTNNLVSVYVDNAQVAVFTAGGNVGIGTTGPLVPLHIIANTANT